MCAVVEAVLSRHCLALGRKLVYNCLFFFFFFGRGRTPPKYDQWKAALLWMSVETISNLLAGLWHSYSCSVLQRGMSAVWSWRALCAVLSSVLASSVILGRPLYLSGLEFLHCKVKVLTWMIADVSSISKSF